MGIQYKDKFQGSGFSGQLTHQRYRAPPSYPYVFCGQALLNCARQVKMPHNGQPTVVRVGIHTGDVTTGLIGTKLPKFSVFGDTMNTVCVLPPKPAPQTLTCR